MASNTNRLRPMGMATPSSALPVVNSRVERRHQALVQKSLDERLWRVKAQVDCRRSGEGVPTLIDAKGQLAKIDREKQIQKENIMLVKKLQAIRMSTASSSSLGYTAKPGLLLQPGGGGPKIDMGLPVRSSLCRESSILKRESMIKSIELQNKELKEKFASAKPFYRLSTMKEEAEKQKLQLQKLRRRPEPAWGSHAQHPKPWDSRCGVTDAPRKLSDAEARTSTCSLPQVAPKRTMSYDGGKPRYSDHPRRSYASADGGPLMPARISTQRPAMAKRERFSELSVEV